MRLELEKVGGSTKIKSNRGPRGFLLLEPLQAIGAIQLVLGAAESR